MAKIPKYYVRPDGLHETILRITLPDGRKTRKAFRGKTDKEVWEKVKAYNAEKDTLPTGVLFPVVADAWLESIEETVEYNTRKGYLPSFERAKEHFKNDVAADITAKDIDKFIKDFAVIHAKKTVVTQLQVIRQILRYAEVEGYIQYNPAYAVRPPKNLKKTRREAPSKEQIELIKNSAGVPFGLFACLVYYTGCRRGEALALTGQDFDLENNTVSISKSVYYEGNFPHIKRPKTEKGTRVIPLLDGLKNALPKKLPKGYLFAEPDGSLLTNKHVTTLYDNYRKETGVTVTPHQIRHGYASALFECGVEPKVAQELLGHAQLSTTMDIYTHVYENAIKSAADKMNSGF